MEPTQRSERHDPRLRVRMVDLVVSMTEAAGSNRRLAYAAGVSETTVRNFKRGAFPRGSAEMGRRLDQWAATRLPEHPGVGSAGSLQDLLERWQGAEPARGPEPPDAEPAPEDEQPARPPRTRLVLALASVLVVLVAAAGVGWWALARDDTTGSGVADVVVDPTLFLDHDNFCTWQLGTDPIPLASVRPLVMRVDARCSYPAEPDPFEDPGSAVYDAPDNDTATKVGVIRDGNTFEPDCFVEGADEVSDGRTPANTSTTWLRSVEPAGYLPVVNVGGGYTVTQLSRLGLDPC